MVGGIPAPWRSGTIAEKHRRRLLAQPRVAVGIALVLVGVGWAIVRGLEFYGLTPAHIYYDLDQPPLLLMLVGIWLVRRVVRSR